MLEIDLPADADATGRLAAEIERFAESAALDPVTAARLMTALDEIVTNAMSHGGLEPEDRIGIGLGLDATAVTAIVTDPGPPFDPLSEAPMPDLAAPLDERPIGGLGLLIVRQLAREISYERAGERNRLTIVLDRE